MNDPVYRPVIYAAKTLFFVQGTRFTILGAEHVPQTGGAVMAINHTSYLDFTYAGLPAWPHRRYVRFMAKKSIFGHRRRRAADARDAAHPGRPAQGR